MLGVSLSYHKIIIRDFPFPEPGPGEVRVKVKASGICRADMSLYNGKSVFGKTPGNIIVGHEPTGIVDSVGSGVSRIKVGNRVGIYLAVGCGYCKHCRTGNIMHCKDFKCIGFDLHGGDAEYIVIPEGNCLKIPDEMNFIEAVVSLDVIGTLYHAEKRLGISGVDDVAIFGIGPMGGGAIMVAKALGAKVIAVDILDSRLELAKKWGADILINSTKEDVKEKIKKHVDGGVSVVIDCSGNPKAQQETLEVVAVHGRIAWVGASTETVINPRDYMTRKQLTLIGSWYFNIGEYDEICNLIRRHNMPLEKLVTHKFSLEEAEKAFTLFNEHKTGKVVFTP